jgi:hypothetical protein
LSHGHRGMRMLIRLVGLARSTQLPLPSGSARSETCFPRNAHVERRSWAWSVRAERILDVECIRSQHAWHNGPGSGRASHRGASGARWDLRRGGPAPSHVDAGHGCDASREPHCVRKQGLRQSLRIQFAGVARAGSALPERRQHGPRGCSSIYRCHPGEPGRHAGDPAVPEDGTPFWAMLFASPLHDGEGTVTNHFLSYLDITRRFDAEEGYARSPRNRRRASLPVPGNWGMRITGWRRC